MGSRNVLLQAPHGFSSSMWQPALKLWGASGLTGARQKPRCRAVQSGLWNDPFLPWRTRLLQEQCFTLLCPLPVSHNSKVWAQWKGLAASEADTRRACLIYSGLCCFLDVGFRRLQLSHGSTDTYVTLPWRNWRVKPLSSCQPGWSMETQLGIACICKCGSDQQLILPWNLTFLPLQCEDSSRGMQSITQAEFINWLYKSTKFSHKEAHWLWFIPSHIK